MVHLTIIKRAFTPWSFAIQLLNTICPKKGEKSINLNESSKAQRIFTVSCKMSAVIRVTPPSDNKSSATFIDDSEWVKIFFPSPHDVC